MDDEGEDVARLGRQVVARIDQVQVNRRSAFGPGSEPRGPPVQRLRRIGRVDLVRAGLQPGVDEAAGHVPDAGVGRVVGEDHGDVVLAGQGDEGRRAEAVMAHLDSMTQRQAAGLVGQQLQEGSEVGLVERLGVGELPEHGAELGAELGDALGEEPLDRLLGLRQDAPVGAEAVALDREDEAIGRVVPPLGEGRGFLRAVVGRVDLNRRDASAHVVELVLLGQALGVKRAAPGLKHPAADPDSDPSSHHGALVSVRF